MYMDDIGGRYHDISSRPRYGLMTSQMVQAIEAGKLSRRLILEEIADLNHYLEQDAL